MKASDEIEALLAQMKLEMFNTTQVDIGKRYAKVIKLKRSIFTSAARKKTDVKMLAHTLDAKEVEKEEGYLLASLKQEVARQQTVLKDAKQRVSELKANEKTWLKSQ